MPAVAAIPVSSTRTRLIPSAARWYSMPSWGIHGRRATVRSSPGAMLHHRRDRDGESGERGEQRDDARRLRPLVSDQQRGERAEEREVDRPGEQSEPHLSDPLHHRCVDRAGDELRIESEHEHQSDGGSEREPFGRVRSGIAAQRVTERARRRPFEYGQEKDRGDQQAEEGNRCRPRASGKPL